MGYLFLDAASKHVKGIFKFKQIDTVNDSYVHDLLKSVNDSED